MTDGEPKAPADDAALLAEARAFLEERLAAESENRAEAVKDLAYLKGEQWPKDVKAARDLERRPSLTINKLPTFLAQVTNDQRQNKPAIKAHPVDEGADPETARVVQGMIRHIEYSSNADTCYDTAANSAAACGFGYWRLVNEYESEETFDQVVRFDRIRDPFSVFLGHHKEADASDMRRALIVTDVARAEFEAEHPKANLQDFSSGRDAGAVEWVTDKLVKVGLYYRVECDPAELWLLKDGKVAWADEAPKGAKPVNKRRSERRRVMLYKLTAHEVLERTEVPCYWIPVFPVFGAEIDVEGKVYRAGLIRFARDPQYMYNLWMSAATEEVALRTKTPYIGAEGQFEGHEKSWKVANQRSLPYLQYKPKTVDGQLVPPPQRQPMADVPVGTLQMAMHASDEIKATTGIFDASLGARGNETSGKAILARQREGDVATYHFTDNLARSIRHCARCIMWMLPRVYDTSRVVRIMGEDETPEFVRINQPLEEPQKDPKSGAVRRVLNDLSIGTYDVTVSMGPSYSTAREEAADKLVQLGGAWPKLMDVAGDEVVKTLNIPGGDRIAERIKRAIPPEIVGNEDGEGPVQVPPQIQMALTQLEQYAAHLEQQLAEAESGLAKAQLDAETKIEVAQINADGKRDVEELRGAIDLLMQKVTAMATPQPVPAAEPGAAPAQPAAPAAPSPDPLQQLSPLIDAINAQSQSIAQVIRKLNAKRRLQFDEYGEPVGVEYVEEPEGEGRDADESEMGVQG